MPYSWEVYGSFDGVNFTLIDTKTSTALLEVSASKNFEPDVKDFKLRYLKVVQTTNYNSRDFFCLNKIELFGKLIQDVDRCTSYKSFYSKNNRIICMLVCFLCAI